MDVCSSPAAECLECSTPQVNNPELYDPSTGTFSLTGAFAGHDNVYVTGGPYVSAAVALSDGRVLIAGVPTSELYDPLTGTFELTGVMTTAYLSCGNITGRTATLLTNGQVLLTGGSHEDCGRFADAELYDVVTGTFTATGSMNASHAIFHSATLLPDGTVLITGGEVHDGERRGVRSFHWQICFNGRHVRDPRGPFGDGAERRHGVGRRRVLV